MVTWARMEIKHTETIAQCLEHSLNPERSAPESGNVLFFKKTSPYTVAELYVYIEDSSQWNYDYA